MAKKYNVMWIDDEHEKMSGFKLQAAQNDIVLNSFKSSNAGIAELIKNYSLYDGVLFDAKFFEDEDDAAGSEDLSALNKVKESLMQLPKKFEMFVLTGQAQLFEDKTFNTFVPKFYRKGIADDINRLFADLKSSADNQLDTQIRHEYHRVFAVCADSYLGSKTESILLSAILNGESEDIQDNLNSFNMLRGVLEVLFKRLNEIQIIPNLIFEDNGWINRSSLFLAGKHKDYKWIDNPIHPTILKNLHHLLDIVQDASHEIPDKLSLKVKDFVEKNNTNYLYKSSLYLLLDILVWYKDFVDAHRDIELNKTKWCKIETNHEGAWILGKIARIASNGYGTFVSEDGVYTGISILPKMVSEHQLEMEEPIEVILKSGSGDKMHIDKIKKRIITL